jgi:phage-related protein
LGVKTTILTFDGVSSEELGITVEGYTSVTIPERDVEAVSVPGRNGDLLIDRGAYKNYDQAYTCHWRIDNDRNDDTRWWMGNASRNSRLSWWLGKSGYYRLTDSLFPEHYRLAHASKAIRLDNRMNVLGRGEIVFNCKPQWYRVEGEEPYSMNMWSDTTITINNPTKNEALPIIRLSVDPGEDFVLTINGNSIKVDPDAASDDGNLNDSGFLTIEIDSETQNAIAIDGGGNRNKYVTVPGEFPTLVPGENTVTASGTYGYINIYPRWWDLIP